jgi:LCP family protein required for cell wall assembly
LPRTRAQDDQLNARVASSAGAKSSRHKKNSDRQQETGASLSRANAASHYAQKRKKRRRLGAVKVIVAVVAAVLVGGGVAAWAYVNNIQSKLSSGIDSALRGQLTTTETGQPFYMLLLGVDKNADRENSSEYGSADSAYRSDSIMLARVDPQNKKVTLVSIHRDTAVNITYTDSSGKTVTATKEKINAAYSLGGPSCCVSTVSQFAGVNISHYAEVDFDSFCDIVNTIGGIEVDVPVDVYDPEYTGADIKAGVQTLDGDQALQLCRARHAYDKYGDGDLYRAANQRAVIAAIMRKIMKMDPRLHDGGHLPAGGQRDHGHVGGRHRVARHPDERHRHRQRRLLGHGPHHVELHQQHLVRDMQPERMEDHDGARRPGPAALRDREPGPDGRGLERNRGRHLVCHDELRDDRRRHLERAHEL